MMRIRNNLMCDIFVQKTQRNSYLVLNNKTRYVLYRIAGWMAMEPTRESSSWGRCTWQVRLMMASFGAWELESNRVSLNRR